MFKTTYMEIP